MVNIDIDREIYDDLKKLVKDNKYEYPSIKFCCQKLLLNEIKKIRQK